MNIIVYIYEAGLLSAAVKICSVAIYIYVQKRNYFIIIKKCKCNRYIIKV